MILAVSSTTAAASQGDFESTGNRSPWVSADARDLPTSAPETILASASPHSQHQQVSVLAKPKLEL